MGNFAENLNLGNRVRPPPPHLQLSVLAGAVTTTPFVDEA